MGSENIVHCAAVRFRVTGAGNLKLRLQSYDDVIVKDLQALGMSAVTSREPRVLTNFKQQRMKLKISTEVIDEVFEINRIIFYIKPLWADYPG